ncbi:MAG: AMP-binding protein, partial [Lentisphaeria bacterium]|nr:AMP-binding protein [Lentisphaeria bacterium]
MENQLKLIGGRIEETRKVLEISVEEMAQVTGVTPEEYLAHERGDVDHSFTFIYHCAKRFGVDISALVLGETPKLSFYSLTRKDGGMPLKRRHDFEYQHLASNFKNRQAEPFLVTAPAQDGDPELHLSSHAGQEFDYILSGRLKVQLGDKVEIMNPGDSIVYNSGQPHGMAAYGDEPCKFLAFVMKGDAEETAPAASAAAAAADAPVAAEEDLIYRRFTDETLDENGNLKDIKFHYPENFNFAYDVLDALAEKKPDAPALIWLDRDHNRRTFSYRDISENSKRAANYLSLIGIKRGDRVMLVLKRHYQYWFILNALHRIGAIAVPVSNQLVAK